MTRPSMYDVPKARGTIGVSFQMPLQRMRDILTLAYEAGIGYWAASGVQDAEFKHCEDMRDVAGDVYGIRFTYHDNHVCVVTDTDLAAAIGRALNVGDNGRPLYKLANEAAVGELNGEADTNTADVLVQFALFGSVKHA